MFTGSSCQLASSIIVFLDNLPLSGSSSSSGPNDGLLAFAVGSNWGLPLVLVSVFQLALVVCVVSLVRTCGSNLMLDQDSTHTFYSTNTWTIYHHCYVGCSPGSTPPIP